MGESHGYIKGRSPMTFYSQVLQWPRMQRLDQIDFIKCFDSVNRDLLIYEMLNHKLVSDSIVLMVRRLLRVSIVDQKGEECNPKGTEFGLHQGCSISPILLNIFLTPLDVELNKLATGYGALPEGRQFYYWARYADDFLFGLPLKDKSDADNFEQRAFDSLKFALRRIHWSRFLTYTRSRMFKPDLRARFGVHLSKLELKVLGLRVTLKKDGSLKPEILFQRWRRETALPVVLHWLAKKGKECSFANVLDALHTRVCTYANYALGGGANPEVVKKYGIAQLRTQIGQFLRQERGKQNPPAPQERQQIEDQVHHFKVVVSRTWRRERQKR